MAPLPDHAHIRSYLSTFLTKRNPSASPAATSTFSDLSPRAALLVSRAQNILPRSTLADASAGVTDPTHVPNKFVFVVFALIGVGFVLTGIWFFFWAKNGGFYFQENDWDDYKSTVLRKKGPNGTTLSGATESTDLGGGSVVHGEKRSIWAGKKKGKKHTKPYKDFEFDDETAYTGSTLGASEISEMKYLAKQAKKNKKAKKAKKDKDAMSEVATTVGYDEEMDVGVREDLMAYRHEKPARVGGINKEPDSSAWDGSTNRDDNSTAASELLSHREKSPTSTPTKQATTKQTKSTRARKDPTKGIRKVAPSTSEGTSVSSFWTRGSEAGGNKKVFEEDHIKAEAAKLQAKGRAAQRRDFSFQHGDDGSTVTSSATVEQEERAARREARREERRASRSPQKKAQPVPGSWDGLGSEAGTDYTGTSSDVGTKSYHHVIPGLSATAAGSSEYGEQKRKQRRERGGYRRGRGEDDIDE